MLVGLDCRYIRELKELLVQRWRGLDQIPAGWGRCVLTIGVFDGVHRGHQTLIARAVSVGHELGLPVVVMSFDPHPAQVVRAGNVPAQLTTLQRRAELVAEYGAEVFMVLPFDTATAAIEPDVFVHDIIVGKLHAAAVVVGENFRFGRRAAGTVALLGQLGDRFGFLAQGVGIVAEDDVTLSSTYIRSCVAAGDMGAAAQALGRLHRIDGFVVHGEGRGGSKLGYPTANLDVDEHTAVPADGIYAGWFLLGNRRSPAAISIGSNPTFSGDVRTIEAFVLDEGGNFYGRRVGLEFAERIRGMEKFETPEALIEQIAADVAKTRVILNV